MATHEYKKMTEIVLEPTHNNVKFPEKKTKLSSCYDIRYQPSQITRDFKNLQIYPGQTLALPTGLKIKDVIGDITEDMEIQVRPRSGLAVKGLTVTNSPGTIDLDYRDEIKIILTNLTKHDFIVINEGDRIAQIKPINCRLSKESCIIHEDERKGGFGSTGVN